MLHGRWGSTTLGRVNPLAPILVAAVGLAFFVANSRPIGVGIVIGSVLAVFNAVLLSKRVDLAADTGDVGQALLIMQMGLVITCTIIGIATIILLHFSLQMAVAAAGGFAVAQVAMLMVFYLTQGRAQAAMKRGAS